MTIKELSKVYRTDLAGLWAWVNIAYADDFENVIMGGTMEHAAKEIPDAVINRVYVYEYKLYILIERKEGGEQDA